MHNVPVALTHFDSEADHISKRLRRENEYLTEEVKAGRNQRLLVGASPSFG